LRTAIVYRSHAKAVKAECEQANYGGPDEVQFEMGRSMGTFFVALLIMNTGSGEHSNLWYLNVIDTCLEQIALAKKP
jgi:hypothetical protein